MNREYSVVSHKCYTQERKWRRSIHPVYVQSIKIPVPVCGAFHSDWSRAVCYADQ